ncbi:MAG: hypothetical protein AB7T31_06070 [Gemmatimonadales bacterium]
MRTSLRPFTSVPLSLALAALFLAVGACGDTPLTPDEAGASQGSTMALFAEILDKLETIEGRIDSLEAAVESSGGGGELVLTGLPAAQLDSVLMLASYLAEDAVGGSWEACGNIDLAGEFGFEWVGEAEGEGAGHLGAWAGTGAYAGGKLSSKAALGGGIKLEGGLGVEFCHPLGAGSPPVRPAPAGPARAPALDGLRTTLTNATTQFNLTPDAVAQSITGVAGAISAPASFNLLSIGDQLPLPSALSGLANDPVGAVAGGLQGLMSTAQSGLCSGTGWGGPVSNVIANACNVIGSGGIGNFTVLADVASTYPAIQTAVSNACGRINSIGLQRLVISSWDVTFPLGIGTVNVFPGYNQRLFPNYTSFACP